MATIDVIHNVGKEIDGWELCFQWGLWHFDDGAWRIGFRFIWKDPDGRMKPYRGQDEDITSGGYIGAASHGREVKDGYETELRTRKQYRTTNRRIPALTPCAFSTVASRRSRRTGG